MKPSLRFASALLTCVLASANAHASGLDDVKKLSQEAFTQLAKDLASITALRALAPSLNVNLLGFDLGVEVGFTNVDNSDVWKRAGGGSSTVVSPRVSIQRGFSNGLDIGATLGTAGSSGLSTAGLTMRYQFVEPTTLLPGMMGRVTGNREFGASAVDVRNYGLDLVVAKPLVIVTPYVGAGTTRSESRATGTALNAVSVSRSRLFVGADANLGVAKISVEAEKSGGATTVSSKVGFRF